MKYYMVIIINLYPPEEVVDIWLIRSSAHIENGHNDCMDCNAYDGWLNRLECFGIESIFLHIWYNHAS